MNPAINGWAKENQTIQEKFKQPSRQIAAGSAINPPLRWLRKMLALTSGADSKTGLRLEQSEMVRTSTRSVEVSVETEELAQIETMTAGLAADGTLIRDGVRHAEKNKCSARRDDDEHNLPLD